MKYIENAKKHHGSIPSTILSGPYSSSVLCDVLKQPFYSKNVRGYNHNFDSNKRFGLVDGNSNRKNWKTSSADVLLSVGLLCVSSV